MNADETKPAPHNKPTGWYGIFYFAPADRRVIVPKPFGWGYTLNFARPMTAVVLGALLLAPLVVLAAVLLTRP